MSATIYEFPARDRYAIGSQAEQINTVMTSFASPRNAKIKTVIGSSWYHEEAIEAERLPKN